MLPDLEHPGGVSQSSSGMLDRRLAPESERMPSVDRSPLMLNGGALEPRDQTGGITLVLRVRSEDSDQSPSQVGPSEAG